MSETLEPSEMTAEEAFNSLNFIEIQAMKNRFGVSLSQIEELAVEAVFALVWILERRKEHKLEPLKIKELPLSEVMRYFREPDPDPDSDQGKESTPDDSTSGS